MTADRSAVEEVRRRHSDPVRVVSDLGLAERALRVHAGLLILCPWHGERTPSCSVTRGDDGTIRAHCFACGASGDVLSLFAAVHGLDVRRDFRRVLELAGAVVAPTPTRPRFVRSDVRPQVPPVLDADSFDRVARSVLDLAPLDAQPDVCEYLARRGVLDEARRAGWGALPVGGAALVRTIVGQLGAEVWNRSALGALHGAIGFRHPDHRVLIPYRAPGVDGSIVTLQRRRIDGGEGPKYVFPQGRGAPLWPFGGEAIEEAGEDTAIVFCEGAIDALTLRRRYREQGLDRIVLGVPSATAWRSEWARLATGRVAIVASDNDTAGDALAAQMQTDLATAGARAVVRARPIGAKDWNSQTEVAA